MRFCARICPFPSTPTPPKRTQSFCLHCCAQRTRACACMLARGSARLLLSLFVPPTLPAPLFARPHPPARSPLARNKTASLVRTTSLPSSRCTQVHPCLSCLCVCLCSKCVCARARVCTRGSKSNCPFTNPSARLRLRANLPEQAVLCPEPQVTAPFLVGALPARVRSRSTSIAPTRKAEKHCCLEQQRTASFSTKRKTSLVTPAEPQRLEGTSLLDALTVPCHSLNWSRTDSSPRRHLPFLFHPPATPPLPVRAPPEVWPAVCGASLHLSFSPPGPARSVCLTVVSLEWILI